MRKRFGTLDFLRGIAAVFIVFFHISQVRVAEGLAPHAYLAVDFFFILSGFVIARTYEKKIASGAMSALTFLSRRAIRLYPLIFLGVALGAVVMLLKAYVDPTRSFTSTALLIDTFANLFLLPAPLDGPGAHRFLFPGNGVLWSLFFEAAINIAWSVWLVRMRTSQITFIVIAAFTYLATSIIRANTANLGYDWATFASGIARVTYGFGLGVLVYRAMPIVAASEGIAHKGASIVLLTATLMSPAVASVAGLFDVVAVGFLLPLTLLLGINAADHPRLDTILGEISYPLYVVHFPILLIASGLHQKAPHLGMVQLLGGIVITLIGATTFALICIDRPMRAALVNLARSNTFISLYKTRFFAAK